MKCFSVLKESAPSSLEISAVKWSPCADLLAVCGDKGEVFVQRRSWKRAWYLQSPIDGSSVSCCCWSPSGDYLVVAYSSGLLKICNIDNGSVVHEIQPKIDDASGSPKTISQLYWFESKRGPISKEPLEDFDFEYEDFLAPLPSLNGAAASVAKGPAGAEAEATSFYTELFHADGKLSLLLTVSGDTVDVYAYAFLPMLSIKLNQLIPTFLTGPVEILSACLSPDCDRFFLVLRVPNAFDQQQPFDIHYSVIQTDLFGEDCAYVAEFCSRMAKIYHCKEYLGTVVENMLNIWEDIILEMDRKFANFAKTRFLLDGGTVGDSLLELMMFGDVSAELEQFLLHELTEKGLKKFGQTIESTYAALQKLAAHNLEAVTIAIRYHLAELRRWAMSPKCDLGGVFERLGATEETIQPMFSIAGQLMLKISEMQLVIERNRKNLKEFFRWLYAQILIISESSGGAAQPPVNEDVEARQFSTEAINFVVKFIEENLLREWKADELFPFKLEKVGQYLQNAPLSQPPNLDNPEWVALMEKASPELRHHPLLCQNDPKASLIQQQKDFSEALATFADGIKLRANQTLNVLKTWRIMQTESLAEAPIQVLTSFAPGVLAPATPTKRLAAGGRSRTPPLPPAGSFRCYLLKKAQEMLLLAVDSISGEPIARTIGLYSLLRHSISHADLYAPDRLALLLVAHDNGRESPPPAVDWRPPPTGDDADAPKQYVALHQWEVFSPPEPKPGVKRTLPPLQDHVTKQDWSMVDVGNSEIYGEIVGFAAAEIHVCGAKKNGCLLSSTRTQVRLLDMEAMEEEDESNSLLDTSG